MTCALSLSRRSILVVELNSYVKMVAFAFVLFFEKWQLLTFLSSKIASLYHQKKKPGRVRWTLTWRKNHKKVKAEGVAKTRAKRVVKIIRAVGGMSVDELKKKKFEKPEVRQAAREAALRFDT